MIKGRFNFLIIVWIFELPITNRFHLYCLQGDIQAVVAKFLRQRRDASVSVESVDADGDRSVSMDDEEDSHISTETLEQKNENNSNETTDGPITGRKRRSVNAVQETNRSSASSKDTTGLDSASDETTGSPESSESKESAEVTTQTPGRKRRSANVSSSEDNTGGPESNSSEVSKDKKSKSNSNEVTRDPTSGEVTGAPVRKRRAVAVKV